MADATIYYQIHVELEKMVRELKLSQEYALSLVNKINDKEETQVIGDTVLCYVKAAEVLIEQKRKLSIILGE